MSIGKGSVGKVTSALAIIAISASLGLVADWRAPGIGRYTRDWLMRARGPSSLLTCPLVPCPFDRAAFAGGSMKNFPHASRLSINVEMAGITLKPSASIARIKPS